MGISSFQVTLVGDRVCISDVLLSSEEAQQLIWDIERARRDIFEAQQDARLVTKIREAMLPEEIEEILIAFIKIVSYNNDVTEDSVRAFDAMGALPVATNEYAMDNKEVFRSRLEEVLNSEDWDSLSNFVRRYNPSLTQIREQIREEKGD